MATPAFKHSFSVAAQEELICPLCYELFCGLCEPKELDCVHVFCQICLLRMVGMEAAITCPECRHVTHVPPGGVSSLKCILRLRNLAEKYAKHCKDLPITGASSPHVAPKESDSAKCLKHEGEKLYFLCVTCNVSICQFCLVRSHTPPAHEIQEMKTSREELQTELQHAISQADEAKKRLEEHSSSVSNLISRTESAVTEEVAAIDRHVKDVIKEVQEKGEELKSCLQVMKTAQMMNMNREKDRLSERIHNIKVTQATARKTRANLPDNVYTTRYKPVVKKLQLLCNAVTEEFKEKIYVSKFSPDFTSQIHIGKVEIYLKAQPVTEFGKFEFARAIASLADGDGFVVADFYGKQTVVVEENGKYKEQMILELKDQKYGPTDVAVTSAGDYLLATWTGVQVFSPDGTRKSTFAADKCELKEGIYSVTTTTEDRVLVGNIETSSIAIHAFDGDLQKTLKVAVQPYHITSNGTHVAISQEVTNTMSVVCLELSEEVFRVTIDGVHGLCYENKSNSLLVGKTSSDGKTQYGSIEQYCGDTGRWIGQLASGLYSPQALTLTQNGTLAVADRKNVQVFQLS